MKLELNGDMSFEAMEEILRTELPQYKTSLKKNPLLGFRYLEIKKSGFVGVWIRVFEKKNQVVLINAMPSPFVRAMLGGLLFILFTHSAQSHVRKECGEVLKRRFSTREV